MTELVVLNGTYTAAVKGYLYSEDYHYADRQQHPEDDKAPTQSVAYAEALKAYARLKEANPDKVVRLLHRPVLEFLESDDPAE